jgi:hypothetical protein
MLCSLRSLCRGMDFSLCEVGPGLVAGHWTAKLPFITWQPSYYSTLDKNDSCVPPLSALREGTLFGAGSGTSSTISFELLAGDQCQRGDVIPCELSGVRVRNSVQRGVIRFLSYCGQSRRGVAVTWAMPLNGSLDPLKRLTWLMHQAILSKTIKRDKSYFWGDLTFIQ